MAERFFLSRHRYILLACFVISDVTATMTSSLWNKKGENIVTSSVATINGSRGATRCVMECHQMESCVSVAFDPESDICYLQPTYRPARQGDDGPLDVYTREKVSECKLAEAPNVTNAHISKWQVTSPSLDGDVSCDEDYMLSEDVTPRVGCQLDSGAWTTLMGATCKQSVWRNYNSLSGLYCLYKADEDCEKQSTYSTTKVSPATLACPLPRPAKAGLCVRVNGTLTTHYRFYINLETIKNDIVLHLIARLVGDGVVKTTEITAQKGGVWDYNVRVLLTDPSPPFPFAVGVPFQMVITAVSLYNFTVEVNGALYGSFKGPFPVTDVVRVRVFDDLHLHYLSIGYC